MTFPTEETKYCSKCDQDVPRSQFTKRRAALDGLQGYCKPCFRQYQKENAFKYEASKREQQQRHRLVHGDRLRARFREYYNENRERLNAKSRAYYRENRDAVLAQRRARRAERRTDS